MNKKYPLPINSLPSINHAIKRILTVSTISLILFSGLFVGLFTQTNDAHANDDPARIVEKTVTTLLEELSENRAHLQGNNHALFELVNQVASPLFDFDYIAKLVLASSWRQASAQQREVFANEFKRLIIITYATALFQYTGNETIKFGKTKIKEQKGIKSGTVNTEIKLSKGSTIPVSYSLIQRDHQWKVYNLTVGSLNMVLSYRNIFQASIRGKGLQRMIADLKSNNDKHYGS